MTTQQHDDGSAGERLRNIGLVVDRGNRLERTLCEAFCSIVGSKYAAVLAERQSAKWLIDNCRAVLDRHREITGEHRANIGLALDVCDGANKRRNDLVHGIRMATAAADAQSAASNGAESQSDVWPAEMILEVADEISAADTKLVCVLRNVFSPEAMVIGAALAWEERRERGTLCE